MNAPYTETISAGTGIICTQLKDRDNRLIYTMDMVQDAEGFAGMVLFINGAFRVDATPDQNGLYLRHNSSLLFKEGVGTAGWQIV